METSERLLLEQWLRAHPRGFEEYVDPSGRSWTFEELDAHAGTRVEADVSALWSASRAMHLWGESEPVLEAALTAVSQSRGRKDIFALLLAVVSADSWTAHLARIHLFISSLTNDIDVPEMILGPDGFIWDGNHRLVALVATGVRTITVRVMDRAD